MGLTVEQYENTPALTVDWDLEIHHIQTQVDEQREQARLQSLMGGGA